MKSHGLHNGRLVMSLHSGEWQSVSFQESKQAVAFFFLARASKSVSCSDMVQLTSRRCHFPLEIYFHQIQKIFLAHSLMLGKLIFLFAEYNLDSDIVDGSGPFESRILNMASPEIQKNLQQIQFSLVIITCKILFFFSLLVVQICFIFYLRGTHVNMCI